MTDKDLRTCIMETIRRTAANNPRCSYPPGPLVAGAYADAVTDMLIDMAGTGELLKAIDRMYR